MTLDNRRITLYSFVAIGIIVWYVLWRVFDAVVELAIPGMFIGTIALSDFLGLAAAAVTAAAGVLVWRNEVANRFSGEVVVELKKVTWPGWKELRGSTLIVLIMTLIIAAILWAFDKVFDLAIRVLL